MPTPQHVNWATLGFVLLSVGACTAESAEKPKAAAQPPEVGVVVLRARSVALQRELPGRTVATLRAEVRPQIGGVIQARLFEEGAEVEQGQVLYRIDRAPWAAAVAEAEAALKHAEALVTAARLRSERYADLVDMEAVSAQEADDAQAAFQQAVTQVAQQKAALQTARIRLAYTEIRAPIAGRIGISTVTEGALVTDSQVEALATIRNLDRMYVDLTQSSTQLLELRRLLRAKGVRSGESRVILLLEDGSRYPHPGSLKLQEVAVQEDTGAVTLRAEFPNPEHWLLPGMYVRAQLAEAQLQEAIVAPQPGIMRRADGKAEAWVVNDNDRIESRTVQTQRTQGAAWIVRSGLKDGDRLVVEGISKVKVGEVVRAVKVEREEPSGSEPAVEPPAGQEENGPSAPGKAAGAAAAGADAASASGTRSAATPGT